jgi:hypothetical protein
MTYRARNAARRAHRPPRWLLEERRPKRPLTFASATAILKKHYLKDDPRLDWRIAYYGYRASAFFRMIGAEPSKPGGPRGALQALRVPVTMTSLADFEAALYWHQRKLGPDPADYVIARHVARPYR